ncbi:MAG: FecR family protein [Methylotenera sp.]
MTENTIPKSIIEKAVEWHLQLHSASASAADFANFSAWQHQNPAHALAYQRIESMWGKFGDIEPNAAKASIESALKSGKSIKKIAQHGKGITLGFLALVSSYSALQTQPAQVWLAENKTAIGVQRSIVLADGSTLMLNTNTALDIDFSGHQRLIKLYQGEVLITVAKDKSRPLIITTEQGTAQALGTKFNVKTDAEATQVAVVESKVEACTKPSLFSFNQKTCITLHPNQSTTMRSKHIDSARNVDAESISGWSTGTLAIDNQALDQVLVELQRYSSVQIQFNQAEISQMRVSGVLPLHNIEQSLHLLADKLPIQIRKPQNNVMIVQAK